MHLLRPFVRDFGSFTVRIKNVAQELFHVVSYFDFKLHCKRPEVRPASSTAPEQGTAFVPHISTRNIDLKLKPVSFLSLFGFRELFDYHKND